jgi:hypothetical protein
VVRGPLEKYLLGSDWCNNATTRSVSPPMISVVAMHSWIGTALEYILGVHT